MAILKTGSIEDFIKFLESFEDRLESKKEPVKDNFDELPHALAFGISDLVDTKVEEFHDCKVITRTFETEDTTVTIKTKVAKVVEPTEEEMWDESINSILDDLDQEIAWAETHNKMELVKLLNRKRNYIASRR